MFLIYIDVKLQKFITVYFRSIKIYLRHPHFCEETPVHLILETPARLNILKIPLRHPHLSRDASATHLEIPEQLKISEMSLRHPSTSTRHPCTQKSRRPRVSELWRHLWDHFETLARLNFRDACVSRMGSIYLRDTHIVMRH